MIRTSAAVKAGAVLLAAATLGLGTPGYAQESTAVPAAGSTILGDQDSALGLYISPWQEEAPVEIDRPPRLLDSETLIGDSEAFEERIAHEESRKAYRRARVERSR